MIDLAGYKFYIGPEVFTPKPSTLTQIYLANDLIKKMPGYIKVADFGSGTGLISIILKHLNPNINIHAYEKYPDSFAYLEKNIKYHNLDITSHLMDVKNIPDTDFDFIISNPPYYPDSVKPHMVGFNDQSDFGYCGGIEGYETALSFIDKSSKVLNKGGCLVIAHLTMHNEIVLSEFYKNFQNVVNGECDNVYGPDSLRHSITYGYIG